MYIEEWLEWTKDYRWQHSRYISVPVWPGTVLHNKVSQLIELGILTNETDYILCYNKMIGHRIGMTYYLYSPDGKLI